MSRHPVPVLEGDMVRPLRCGQRRPAVREQDVAIAQAIVDTTWAMVQRLREHAEVVARGFDLLKERQHVVGLTTWEWDPSRTGSCGIRRRQSSRALHPGDVVGSAALDPRPAGRAPVDALLRGPQDGAVAPR